MIEIKIGDNLNRQTIMVDENKTVKEVLNENEIDYSRAMMHIDGVPLSVEELNSTFAELNVKDSCYLLAVSKLVNNQ